MIRLFITSGCKDCENIEERLKELCLAHETVTVDHDQNSERNELPEGLIPPVILDDGKIVQGKEAVWAYIETLEKIKAEWDMFQGDSCYCTDRGEIV